MEIPRKLYRAVRKKYDEKLSRSGRVRSAVECHLEGDLLFRSHKYFRDQGIDQEEGVGDYEFEGIVNQDVCKDRPNQPAFFMSFSETIEGSLTCDRNKENHLVLELNNPEGLSNFIKQNLLCSNFVNVKWIQVKYGKPEKVNHDLNPKETWERKYHYKTEEYKCEREWRLQIMFLHSFRILNDDLKFGWMQAERFFEIAPFEEDIL